MGFTGLKNTLPSTKLAHGGVQSSKVGWKVRGKHGVTTVEGMVEAASNSQHGIRRTGKSKTRRPSISAKYHILKSVFELLDRVSISLSKVED